MFSLIVLSTSPQLLLLLLLLPARHSQELPISQSTHWCLLLQVVGGCRRRSTPERERGRGGEDKGRTGSLAVGTRQGQIPGRFCCFF